jgi:hypothetical protein
VLIGFIGSPTLLAIVYKHSEYKPGYYDDPRAHEQVLDGGKEFDLVFSSAENNVEDEEEVDEHEADYHQE